MLKLSNSEYMLLSLIRDKKAASGYQLNTVIKNRGYRDWADIGMTSIYNGLKKLENKGLVQSKLITEKSIQGPAAKAFYLTDSGITMLKKETVKGLTETRERDRRFDLALSAIDLLPSKTALDCIKKRKHFLETENSRLTEICNEQKEHISFQGKLLFKHTLNFIQSEITFLNELISNWEKETEYDH
jgi:DNA-binding PadR family transcriptional regulator